MKHLSLLAAGAMAFGLWSCSSDEPVPTPGGGNSEGDVYAQLTLSLPSTRATTTTDPDNGKPAESDNGEEVGKDYENNVNDLWVVLASQEADGTYTYVAKSQTNAILDQSVVTPTYSVQFQSEELEAYVNPNEGDAEKPIYVFAYCNPTTELSTTLAALESGSKIGDEIAQLAEADANNLPWAQKNGFTMTNGLLTQSSLPNLQTLLKQHNTKATAFNLGTVKVERVVSRFDFMEKPAADGLAANNYMIKDNVSGLDMATVEINGMSLINEANQFYYMPRVSANKDWSNPTLCGYELVTNWMVSPNYAGKMAFADATNFEEAYKLIANNYYFNNNTAAEDLVYTWVTNESDNEGWIDSNGTDYKIWRYATENTMPTDAMKHGITTGVVFRAEIKPLSDDQIKGGDANGIHPAVTLRNAIAAREAIYAYTGDATNPENNVILGSAKDVWQYAYSHASSAIRSQFMAAIAAGKFTVSRDGKPLTSEADIFPTPTADLPFATIVAETKATGFLNNTDGVTNNFMVYNPDANGKYYVYYRYYNRHNDNGRPDVMGPMEFATVRNNIYKLRVNTVAGFGLPGDLPTPPGTDDETPEVFFKVSVQVLNWVVRVNNLDL